MLVFVAGEEGAMRKEDRGIQHDEFQKDVKFPSCSLAAGFHFKLSTT